MKLNTSVRILVLGLAAVASGSLLAHHGGAAYDSSRTVTVTGTVTDFQFVNPHVLIYIAVTGEDGEVVEWSGELTSPNRLARMATPDRVRWHREILKPGDEIELSGNPAVSGAPSLRLRRVVDAAGRAIVDDD